MKLKKKIKKMAGGGQQMTGYPTNVNTLGKWKNQPNSTITNSAINNKQNPPIFTNNPKDPRIQAYQDSLDRYDWSNAHILPNSTSVSISDYLKDRPNTPHISLAQMKMDKNIPSSMMYNKTSDKYTARYNQPVQPVIYQPQQKRPTYEDSLALFNEPKYNNSGAISPEQYIKDNSNQGVTKEVFDRTYVKNGIAPVNISSAYTINGKYTPSQAYYPEPTRRSSIKKEQPINNIQTRNITELPTNSQAPQFDTLMLDKGSYFSRPRQSQEEGQGKTDYFDKSTGKLLKTMGDGGYLAWKNKLPKNLQYEGDYDLRGLYNENPNVQPSANLHFPDTYKLPNHPTFSIESKYYKPGMKAGIWGGGDEQYLSIQENYNTLPIDNTRIDMKKTGGKIHIKKSHEGLLHKDLGVKKGEKIPASKLKIKSTDSEAVRKRKQFALNAKKFHHEIGGLTKYAGDGSGTIDLSGNDINMFGDNGLANYDYSQGINQAPNYQIPQYNRSLSDDQLAPQYDITQFNPNTKKSKFSVLGGENDYFGTAINSVVDGAQSGSDIGLGAGIAKGVLNVGKGVLDLVGNAKYGNQVNKFKNDQFYGQKDGAFRDPFSKYYSDDKYGQAKNPLMLANGGVNDFKAPVHMASAELEGEEVVQTPQGLVGTLQGRKHSEGGIAMNLPENTQVFSEKLKDPMTKKSYAKLAKKFSTEKDMENLEDVKSTDLNKKTAKLNITLKNQKLDEIFAQQEQAKMDGTHGTDVANKTMEDYGMMANGGLTKYGGKGAGKTKGGGGDDNYKGDLDAVYKNATSLGYRGKKDIASLQNWEATINPKELDYYTMMMTPNNKAKKIWKENYGDGPVQMNKMTPEERRMAFTDGLWDYRFPKSDTAQKPNLTITTKKQPVASIPGANAKIGDVGSTQESQNNIYGIPLPITPRDYNIEPIGMNKFSPNLTSYRNPDIEPQLNEINRTSRALSRYLPTNSTGIAQRAQFQANQLNAINQTFGQYNNQVQQGKMGVDQFNANQLDQYQVNQNHENSTVQDLYLKEKGLADTQKRTDNQGDITNFRENLRDQSTYSFINSAYPWANPTGNFSAISDNYNPYAQPEVTKKYQYDPYTGKRIGETIDKKKMGGKIKFSPKKNKLK